MGKIRSQQKYEPWSTKFLKVEVLHAKTLIECQRHSNPGQTEPLLSVTSVCQAFMVTDMKARPICDVSQLLVPRSNDQADAEHHKSSDLQMKTYIRRILSSKQI